MRYFTRRLLRLPQKNSYNSREQFRKMSPTMIRCLIGVGSGIGLLTMKAYASGIEAEEPDAKLLGGIFPQTHLPALAQDLNKIVDYTLTLLPSSTLRDFRGRGDKIAELLRLAKCDEEIYKKINIAKQQIPLDERIDKATHLLLLLIALTQHAFALPVTQERGDSPDPSELAMHRPRIWWLFSEIDFVQEMPADLRNVFLIVVTGGFSFRMWERFIFLVKSLQGYEGELSQIKIHVSAGDRKLDPIRDIKFLKDTLPESWHPKINELKDETDAARLLINYLTVCNQDLSFVLNGATYGRAVKSPIGDGRNRATTFEAAAETKKHFPDIKEAKTQVMSNKPYLGYQKETFCAALSPSLETDHLIEAAGPAANPETPLFDCYDALTRQFFSAGVRLLVRTFGISQKEAIEIISKYKKAYTCESLFNKSTSVPEETKTIGPSR